MSGRKGCHYVPRIDININNVVIDELHLLLRTTDCMLNNVILDSQHQDQQACHSRSGELGPKLQSLVTTTRSCGVGFNAWFKRNSNQEFTNLLTVMNGRKCYTFLQTNCGVFYLQPMQHRPSNFGPISGNFMKLLQAGLQRWLNAMICLVRQRHGWKTSCKCTQSGRLCKTEYHAILAQARPSRTGPYRQIWLHQGILGPRCSEE